MAEPLVLGPSSLEDEIAIAKLKKYKSPGSDKIPAEPIPGGKMLLINCLISGRSLLLYEFTKRVSKLTNNYGGISLLPTAYKILLNIPLSRCMEMLYHYRFSTWFSCTFLMAYSKAKL
jgi:hypothetical protein